MNTNNADADADAEANNDDADTDITHTHTDAYTKMTHQGRGARGRRFARLWSCRPFRSYFINI